jgi:2-keto-4-pentenoate hydratase/2-oxohepta-3-ene-1,7-dioic acid hydratase in catechol pathway
MTLYPGDIISTGSPPGAGPMKPGDIVEVTVKEIGVLRNRVKAEDDKS